MSSEKQRILQLALESLLNKKRRIDENIEVITRELRRRGVPREALFAVSVAPPEADEGRKKARFTKKERDRRSARMRAYWANWRKKKAK